jgi:hypothetical protein
MADLHCCVRASCVKLKTASDVLPDTNVVLYQSYLTAHTCHIYRKHCPGHYMLVLVSHAAALSV